MKTIYLVLFIFLVACTSGQELKSNSNTEKYKENTAVKNKSAEVSYKIIFTEKIGWGYQIYKGSEMVVNQIHIPAIQGLEGFESKEKATIAAEYILSKINNGIFPPTITPNELDSLGVLTKKIEIL